MREDEHLRVLVERVADRRQSRANPRIAGDHPTLHRNVEILPDQDPLVAQVRVRQPQDLHDTFDQATVVSIMRFEKPHSLSYQAQTFTRLPSTTLVSVRVEYRRMRVVVEVHRHQRLDRCRPACPSRRPSQQPPCSSLLTSSTVGRALRREGQIDERHVDRRHANGKSIELALQLRNHETDGSSGARLGRESCDIVAERARRRSE